MATAKTGSFYLTETVLLPVGSAGNTRIQGVIDCGAYVNVATGQALAIESVDYVFQSGATYSQYLRGMANVDFNISAQLSDLNPGSLLKRADDQSLVSSASLNVDLSANIGTEIADFYPDNFGPTALSEAFLVVNDSLYLVGGLDGEATLATAKDIYVTARIKCRIAKLSTKDWMAIAIQSTASDN